MVSHITWQPKCRLILGVLCGWGEDAKLSFSFLIVGRPMQQKDTLQKQWIVDTLCCATKPIPTICTRFPEPLHSRYEDPMD